MLAAPSHAPGGNATAELRHPHQQAEMARQPRETTDRQVQQQTKTTTVSTTNKHTTVSTINNNTHNKEIIHNVNTLVILS